MPNHIHFVVILHDEIVNPVGAPLAGAPDDAGAPDNEGSPTRTNIEGQGQALPLRPQLGDIVGAYKSLVAKDILKIFKSHGEIMGPLWQRNYYEHIIRSNDDFKRIDAYIGSNLMNWADDELFVG